jgi:hypothetical protein
MLDEENAHEKIIDVLERPKDMRRSRHGDPGGLRRRTVLRRLREPRDLIEA